MYRAIRDVSGGVRSRGESHQDDAPPVAIALTLLQHDRSRVPSTMLEFDASAFAVRREFNFDLSRRFPLGSFPRERDKVRRLKPSDAADFEFSTVGKSLEEPAADAALDENVFGFFASEPKPLLQWLPFAHFFREDPEHDLRRTLYSNRFSNRHRFSSTYRLNAFSVLSQNAPTSSNVLINS